jgi:serine/threonine protein phosphatase PrpC
MPFEREQWSLMGASVRGPAHVRAGLPNQDAWHGRLLHGHGLIVVCDGLGSRPRSAEGARAACRAVADALRRWQRVPQADPQLVLRLVHASWNLLVDPIGRDACATTCLFGAVLGDGRIVLAQLGDGLAALKTDREFLALPAGGNGFGNMTTGLGIASDLREWRIQVLPPPQGAVALVLASDGIADDLLAERRADFLDHLIRRHGSGRNGGRALAAALRAWPTPRHLDDKTVAVLWNQEAQRQMEQTNE